MRASEFARKRAKIERRAGDRAAFFRQAMAHLVQEAGAVVIVVRGQLVGWRMQDGGVVCLKRRYRDAGTAGGDLARIKAHARNPHIPVRAYHCQHCGGWHLTSQERGAANDNDHAKLSGMYSRA